MINIDETDVMLIQQKKYKFIAIDWFSLFVSALRK